MQSMTGFGKGQSEQNGTKITVEIKSVNGKFLDINVKAPRFFNGLEDHIKKSIGLKLNRGSVDVFLNFDEQKNTSEVSVDDALVSKYKTKAEEVSKKLKIKNDLKLSKIMSMPDVVLVKKQDKSDDELKKLLDPALSDAIKNINKMREVEGKHLESDIRAIAAEIKNEVTKIEKRIPQMLDEIHDKMKTRVQEILKEIQIDESKLANEMAFFVDKLDVHEEIERLKSHLKQLDEIIKSDEPVGKKLEFLSQELTREINTTGSKSNDIEITKLVLNLKNLVERFKEQIRNVE